MARAHGTLIGLVIEELDAVGVKSPTFNFPAFPATAQEQIESAADKCREYWQLGLEPIEQIGSVAEQNGAILVSHLAHAETIDAFARRGTSSITVLKAAPTSTARWIFDVAHEIGHLVLHAG